MVMWSPRRMLTVVVAMLCCAVLSCLDVSPTQARAAETAAPAQADFWRVEQIQMPPDAVLEVGALEWIPRSPERPTTAWQWPPAGVKSGWRRASRVIRAAPTL